MENNQLLLFERAPDAMFVVSSEGDNISVNAASERLLGYGRAELLTLHFSDLLDNADPRKLSLNALLTQDIFTKPQMLRHRDGGLLPVQMHVSTLPDGSAIMCIREISEQLQAEENLRRKEASMRRAQRMSGVGSWEVDFITGQVFWSEEIYRIIGRDPNSFVPTIDSFYEHVVHPDDRERVASATETALAEKEDYSIEHRVLRADGSIAFVWGYGIFTWDSTGQLLQGSGTVQDITERKKMEDTIRASKEHYRKLIAQSHDAVILRNDKGEVLFVSPAIESILGVPPETFSQSVLWEHIHPDDRHNAQHIFAEAIQNPGKPLSLRLRFCDQQGHWRWLESVCTNWLDDPDIRAIVSNLRDVTSRVELEHKLHHMLKMEAIGRLAGGVAHDFNNLLTVMMGYCDLLQNELEAESELHQYVYEVIKSAQRASDLTRQLLAFSRRQVLQPQILNLNTRIAGMDQLLHRLIGETIKIEIRLQQDLAQIQADPSQLDQILINLALNARDAMPDGGKMTIETRNVELESEYAETLELQAGKYVLLAISDTGIGMDAETCQHVFEPFFTTKAGSNGTGLGLATSYGIAKQSGGHISVYSEPGQGSVFKVFLPVSLLPLSLRNAEPETPLLRTNSETVLVVEDEEAVRRYICKMLEKAGYRVLEATQGAEALVLAQEFSEPIDILITDLVMPVMGGLELAEKLFARRPETRVLYMSGYSEDAMLHKGPLANSGQFMHKPFSSKDLLVRLEQILGDTD